MPRKLQFKRTDLAGRIPTINDIDIGEVALNIADGRMFFKKVEGGKVYVEYTATGDSQNHHIKYMLDSPLIENETYRIEVEVRPGESGWTDECQLAYYANGSSVNSIYYPVYDGWQLFTYEFSAGAATTLPEIRLVGWREGLDGEKLSIGDIKVYAVNDVNQPNLVDPQITSNSGWESTADMLPVYYDGSSVESVVDVFDHNHEINDINGLQQKLDSVDSEIASTNTELSNKVDINNLAAVQVNQEMEKVSVAANTQTFTLSQITLKTNMPTIFMAGYYDSQIITDFVIDSPSQITLNSPVSEATTLTILQSVLVAA